MFVLSKWQFWNLFGTPSVRALSYWYLFCDPRLRDNSRKVRAKRRVSASGAPHVVIWTKQTSTLQQCTAQGENTSIHMRRHIQYIFKQRAFLIRPDFPESITDMTRIPKQSWVGCFFLQIFAHKKIPGFVLIYVGTYLCMCNLPVPT